MSKKIVMKDLARQLGVSINAVSLALNGKPGVSDELRRQVLNLADELGYMHQSPRYEKTFRDNYLCIIMRRRYFSSSNFYSQVLLGIQEEAADHGYGTLIGIYDDEPEIIPDWILKRRVAGVIVLGVVPDTYLNNVKAYTTNLITVDHISHPLGIDSIMTANVEGSYMMTDYILTKGFQKIGYFGDLDYSASIRERYSGIILRLKEAQIDKSYAELMMDNEKHSILYNLEPAIVDQDFNAIRRRLEMIPQLPEVFLCSNDDAAAALIIVLGKMGYRVPDDIAVVGFDDSSVALQITPALTTVHVEMKVMGREGVRRLLWRLHNPRALATRTSIQTRIVCRKSL